MRNFRETIFLFRWKPFYSAFKFILIQDDPYWWQARREWDRSMRAGLIPSRALQVDVCWDDLVSL